MDTTLQHRDTLIIIFLLACTSARCRQMLLPQDALTNQMIAPLRSALGKATTICAWHLGWEGAIFAQESEQAHNVMTAASILYTMLSSTLQHHLQTRGVMHQEVSYWRMVKLVFVSGLPVALHCLRRIDSDCMRRSTRINVLSGVSSVVSKLRSWLA